MKNLQLKQQMKSKSKNNFKAGYRSLSILASKIYSMLGIKQSRDHVTNQSLYQLTCHL